MKNLYKVLFSTLFSAFIAFPNFTHAADQVVTNNDDSGAGSLRQAILDIESSGSDGDEITFNLSGGNETITISSQFALIWQKNFIINGDNVAGSGTDVTVQVTSPGVSNFRIFEIRPYSGTHTIKNMTLRGGALTADQGGAIKVHSGDATGNLTLENVTINDSKAKYGGAIYAWGTMGDITLTDVTIDNCDATNASPYGGGALFIRSVSGDITITGSTFSNNTSTYQGGAIYIYAESFSMDKITVSNNTSSHNGGGIYIRGDNALAAATITNSTINNNEATSGNGGGLHLYYGVHQITNTTIFGNTANIIGAMYMGYGTTTITNSTIANNTGGISDGIYIEGSGTLRMKNTILANNTTTDFSKGTATITDNGYNIVEVSSGYAWSGTGDITGDQASLNLSASLADNATLNGTQTLALSAGSVAIDAGNGTANNGVSIPATDQRGADRNGDTDIGAYEYAGVFGG